MENIKKNFLIYIKNLFNFKGTLSFEEYNKQKMASFLILLPLIVIMLIIEILIPDVKELSKDNLSNSEYILKQSWFLFYKFLYYIILNIIIWFLTLSLDIKRFRARNISSKKYIICTILINLIMLSVGYINYIIFNNNNIHVFILLLPTIIVSFLVLNNDLDQS